MDPKADLQKFRSFLELSSELMAVLSREGRLEEVNSAWRKHMGFPGQQPQGLPFFDLVHPEDLSKTQTEVQKLFNGADAVLFENRCLCRSREYRWIRWSCQWNQDANCFYLVGRDVGELKQTEKDLEETQAKFKRLSESATEGVAIHEKGIVLEANQALARLLGYEREEEVLGLNGLDFIAPEYRQLALGHILSGSEEPYEVVGLRKDGSRFNCLLQGKPIRYQGRIARVSTFLDVTPAKRREQELFESQELFRKLAEASKDGIAVSEKGKILIANEALARMFGYEIPQMVGHHAVEFTAPQFRETTLQKVHGEEEQTYEIIGLRKDGTQFPLEITARMTSYQGRRVRVAFFRDITQRKRIEEEVLRQKEFSQNLINSSLDGLMAFDSQCRYTLWNPAMERLTGHSREEVLGQCAFDIFPFLRQIGQDKHFYEALAGKTVVTGDRPYRTPAGRQGFFESVYTPIRTPQGEIIGGLGVIHDITERKRMEEALRQSEISLKAVFQNTFQNIILLDIEGRVKTFNINAEATYPKKGGGLEIGRPLLEVLPPELSVDFETTFQRALRGEAVQFERRFERENGEEGWLEVGYNPVFGEQGEIDGVCLVTASIDDRKKVEEALQKSEADLRALFNSSHQSIILAGKNGRVRDFNQNAVEAVKRLRGLTLEADRPLADYVEPEHVQAFQGRFKKVLKGEVVRLERVVKSLDGAEHWFEFTYNPVFDGSGGVLGVCLTVEAITERRKAAEALRKSESQLKALFNSVNQNIVLLDAEGTIQNFNQIAAATFLEGLGKTLQSGKKFLDDYVRPEDKALAQERIQKALKGEIVRVERSYRYVDGTLHWLEYAYHPVFGEGGKILGVCFTSQSIDERKTAEEALRDSEEKFRKVFESAPLGMTLVDKDFRFLHTNQSFCRMLGYSELEMTKLRFPDITHPEDLTQNMAHIPRLQKGQGFQMQKRYLRKDGTVLWANLTVHAFLDSKGELLYSLGMVEDITERKRSEEALRESEEKFRKIFEEAPLGMAMVADFRFIKVNRALREMLGYTEGEMIGKTIHEMTHPDDRPDTRKVAQAVHTGEKDRFEVDKRYLRKNGEGLWVHLSGTVLRDALGQNLYSLLMVEDIAQRKAVQEALQRSEADLRAIFNSGSQMIVLIGSDGRIRDFNRKAGDFLRGMTGQVLEKGRLFFDYTLPQFRATVEERFHNVMEGRTVQVERPVQGKDGAEHWFEMTFSPVFDGPGTVAGVCLSSTLIDERKKAEEALQKSEADLRAVFNSGSQVTILIGRDGSIQGFNKSAEIMAQRVLGLRLEKGMPFVRTLPAGASPEMFQMSFETALEGKETQGERRIRSADGQERWVEVKYQPVVNDQGKVEGVCFSLAFIDDRRKAQEALKESQERFERLALVTQEGILLHENPAIVDVNPALATMMGYKPEEMIGKSGFDFLVPESHETARAHMLSGSPEPYEALALRKDGSSFSVELRGGNFHYLGKELRVLSVRDISWRKTAEKTLRESEEHYRRLVEETPLAMIVLQDGGQIVFANPESAKLFRASRPQDLIGKSALDLILPENQKIAGERIRKTIEEGASADTRETELVALDGQRIQVEVRGLPITFQGKRSALSIFRDITESKKTGEMLLRYERLAAVGKVIAAIAHEIRTPLAVVSGMSQLLKAKLETKSVYSQELETILSQANRLKIYMNDILDYSRNMEIHKAEVPLKGLLEQSLLLAQAQLGSKHAGVLVEWKWGEKLPPLFADAARLEQVMVNLILNAYQAVNGNGKITLSAQAEGGWMALGVEDDGPGVPEGDLPRLFEPFFTTKEHGSGLGLPISQKIAQAHGGRIEVKRLAPHGTIFSLWLPLSKKP